jgi:hypothetical protein
MCYNRRAVERTAKQQLTPVLAERKQFSAFAQPTEVVAHPDVALTHPVGSEAQSVVTVAQPIHAGAQEDASRYCPVCSQRLESRRCKLICAVCGYYMSCADYY